MDLYIYYRVATADMSQLQKRVTTMQAQLSQQHQVKSALKRRPQEKDGYHTWMEIYLNVPTHFETILHDAVKAKHLDLLIDGPRHIEYFLDVLPCA